MPRLVPPRGVSMLATLAAVLCQLTIVATPARSATATGEPLPDGCNIVGNDQSKIVCVCNEQKCHDLTFEWPTVANQAWLVETTQSGRRFKARQLGEISTLNVKSTASIGVNLDDRQQEVLGWGAAFTDAATINIHSLSSKLSERLLSSYFGPNGLQYNFGRVPIGGSDFSTRAYSYADSNEPDVNLTRWSLAAEDLTYKIPTIKRATEMVEGNTTDGTNKLKLFASPWSPPKWMKTSNSFKRGHLIDRDDIYRSYANYLVKFYQSYRDHGIEFWGATIQNEPIAAYLPFYFFNSLQMSSSQTINFVTNYLGPALESFGYTKENFKLMVGDDSLGFINYQVPSVMENKLVQKYVSGLAFHWYTSGLVVPYDSLTKLVNKIKDKIEFVIMSEACQGAFLSFKHVDLGDWRRAESYANDIIEDFRRRTGAWIDWNLALDLEGGPNWSGNHVDSPIIVDKSKNEFMKQPMYYVLAHFSRFMRPGSVVVGSTVRSIRDVSVIAAYVESTNHLVVNMLNKSNDRKRFPLEINKGDQRLYTLDGVELEPKSVSSMVINIPLNRLA